LTNKDGEHFKTDKLHLFNLKTNTFTPLSEGLFIHDTNEGPTCSPILNKGCVFFFGQNDISVLDLKSGKMLNVIDQGIKKVKEMPNLTELQKRFIKRRLDK
jgi:hypothetical protein